MFKKLVLTALISFAAVAATYATPAAAAIDSYMYFFGYDDHGE